MRGRSVGRCREFSSAGRMARSAPTTAKNDTAFTKKTHATPNDEISRPTSAGPVMRAEFMTALDNATAFATRSRPTISSRKAWRAG